MLLGTGFVDVGSGASVVGMGDEVCTDDTGSDVTMTTGTDDVDSVSFWVTVVLVSFLQPCCRPCK